MIKTNNFIIDNKTKIELTNCYNELLEEQKAMYSTTKKTTLLDKIINWLNK